MEFFKHGNVLKKLKEDAENLTMMMDYVDEQLNSPCEIHSIEKCWPAEQILMKDLASFNELRSEVQDFSKRNENNCIEIKKFRRNTERFIKTVDAHINDIDTQLSKYGMKPMPRLPIAEYQPQEMF